jgi:hypothetical protein
MNDYITGLLKNLGCSHCQDFEFNDTKNNEKFKNWKLYMKEYDMFSAMTLYNDKIKKNISSIINLNESINLLDDDNNIFLKLEYISNNLEDNLPILVPTDDYEEIYEKIEQMDKIFDKDMNANYIGTFHIKKSK